MQVANPIKITNENTALTNQSKRLMKRILDISRKLGFNIRTLDDFYLHMTLPDLNKIRTRNPAVTEETIIRNLRQRALQLYKTFEVTGSLSLLERQLPCDALVTKLLEARTLVNSSRGGDSEEILEEYQDQVHEGETDGSLWRALFSIPTMREEDDDTASQDSDYEIEPYEDMPEPSLHELTEYEHVEDVMVRYDQNGNELYRSIMDMPVRTRTSTGSGSIYMMGVLMKWIWVWKLSLLVAILSASVSFHIAGKLSTQYMIMYGTTNLNSVFQDVSTDTAGTMLNPYDALSSITEGFNKNVQLGNDTFLQIEPFAKSSSEYQHVWHDYNAYTKEVLAPPTCNVPKGVKVFKDVSHVALSNEFSLINGYIEYMHTCIITSTTQSSPLQPIKERFKKKYAELFVEGTRYPTVAKIVKDNVLQYVVEEFLQAVKSDPIQFNSDMTRLLSELDPETDVYRRMVQFKDRLTQVRSMYKQGDVSTDVCQRTNKDGALSVKTTLHAYTWQLMTDIFNSFHDIGKEQLVIHNKYIPVIKKLLDLKMELREISDSKDYSQAPKKLQAILEEMTKLPQIEPFTTLMVIFESSVPNMMPNANAQNLYNEDFSEMLVPDTETIRRVVNNAVSIIQGRNEQMRRTVDEYIKAYENAEYLESTFSLFGGVREFGDMAIGKLSPVVDVARTNTVSMKVGSQQISVSMQEFKNIAFELQTNIMDTLRRVQFRDTDQLHLNMLAPVMGSTFAMNSLNTFINSSVGKTVVTMMQSLETVDPAFRSITQGMASAWKIGSTLLDTMNKETRFANVRLFHSAIKYNYERAGIANIRNVDKKDGFYALQKSWQVLEQFGAKGDVTSIQSGFRDVMRVLGVRAFKEWTENYTQQTMFEMEMLSNMIMNMLLTVNTSPESMFGPDEAAQLQMFRLKDIVMDGENLFDMQKTSVSKLGSALVKRMIYMVMVESLQK